jgi:hypothetical protein
MTSAYRLVQMQGLDDLPSTVAALWTKRVCA